jgi:hypothetical protein
MNRSILERELKKVGVTLNGWMPVFLCDTCQRRWEPFEGAVGSSAPTARFDYWKCPNKCNANAHVSREVQTAIPKFVVFNEVPGMIFGDEDLPEFRRYVKGMDSTVVPN